MNDTRRQEGFRNAARFAKRVVGLQFAFCTRTAASVPDYGVAVHDDDNPARCHGPFLLA